MWTLLLARLADPPGTFIDRRQFDGGQIKVGRNARSCDWVLPDEHGHISREHCTFSAVGLDLFVIDTSSNGIALNQPGQRIAPQVPVAVRVKDRLLLGDFAIEVATESAGASIGLMPPPPAAVPGASSFNSLGGQPDAWFDTPVDPIWGSGGNNAEVHEFLGSAMHDFLGGPAARGPGGPPVDPAWGGPMGDAFNKPIMAEVAPMSSDFGIPEDWAAPPSASGVLPAADPFADFAPPAAMLDQFGGAALTADPFGGTAPEPFADPFPDPFGGDSSAPAADPFALPMAAPAAVPATDPFAAQTSAQAPPLRAPVAPATVAAATGDADWAAFCEGAGMAADELRLSPDAMHRLGVLYRQVVLGLSDLIQDRAAFKDEFRVERTQLSMGRNNPLKHLPPLDSAKILLGEPLPGFMPASDAVRTAFEDIKKHQLAMLAGVQHALNSVFERLSPAEIEKLMEKAAGSKRGLPFTRGINPWTVYQTVFEALRRDAVSNVNSVMSVAFRDGYEKFLKAGK